MGVSWTFYILFSVCFLVRNAIFTPVLAICLCQHSVCNLTLPLYPCFLHALLGQENEWLYLKCHWDVTYDLDIFCKAEHIHSFLKLRFRSKIKFEFCQGMQARTPEVLGHINYWLLADRPCTERPWHEVWYHIFACAHFSVPCSSYELTSIFSGIVWTWF